MVKIQEQNNRYFATIPKTIVEAKDWEKGTELEYKIKDGKLLIQEKKAEG